VSYSVSVLLGVLAAVLLDVAVLRTRLVSGVAFWVVYPIVLGFQLAANGVLTGVGVVRYAPSVILGVRLAYAPVEDLAFGFALVLSTLSVWVWLGRLSLRDGSPRRPAVRGRRRPRVPGRRP